MSAIVSKTKSNEEYLNSDPPQTSPTLNMLDDRQDGLAVISDIITHKHSEIQTLIVNNNDEDQPPANTNVINKNISFQQTSDLIVSSGTVIQQPSDTIIVDTKMIQQPLEHTMDTDRRSQQPSDVVTEKDHITHQLPDVVIEKDHITQQSSNAIIMKDHTIQPFDIDNHLISTTIQPSDVVTENDLMIQQSADAVTMKDHIIQQPSYSVIIKDHIIQQPSDAATEKDHTIQQPSDSIIEKYHMIQQPSDAATEKDHMIQQPSDAATEKDHTIQQPSDSVIEKYHMIQQPSEIATEKDHMIQQPSNAATEKDHMIQQPSDAATENDHMIQQPSNAATEKDHMIQQPSDAVIEKDRMIQQPFDAVIERDHMIQQPSDAATDNDHMIQQPPNAATEKDHMIQPLSDNAIMKDNMIQSPSDAVIMKDHTIQQPSDSVIMKDHMIQPPSDAVSENIIQQTSNTTTENCQLIPPHLDTFIDKNMPVQHIPSTITDMDTITQQSPEAMLATNTIHTVTTLTIKDTLDIQPLAGGSVREDSTLLSTSVYNSDSTMIIAEPFTAENCENLMTMISLVTDISESAINLQPQDSGTNSIPYVSFISDESENPVIGTQQTNLIEVKSTQSPIMTNSQRFVNHQQSYDYSNMQQELVAASALSTAIQSSGLIIEPSADSSMTDIKDLILSTGYDESNNSAELVRSSADISKLVFSADTLMDTGVLLSSQSEIQVQNVDSEISNNNVSDMDVDTTDNTIDTTIHEIQSDTNDHPDSDEVELIKLITSNVFNNKEEEKQLEICEITLPEGTNIFQPSDGNILQPFNNTTEICTQNAQVTQVQQFKLTDTKEIIADLSLIVYSEDLTRTEQDKLAQPLPEDIVNNLIISDDVINPHKQDTIIVLSDSSDNENNTPELEIPTSDTSELTLQSPQCKRSYVPQVQMNINDVIVIDSGDDDDDDAEHNQTQSSQLDIQPASTPPSKRICVLNAENSQKLSPSSMIDDDIEVVKLIINHSNGLLRDFNREQNTINFSFISEQFSVMYQLICLEEDYPQVNLISIDNRKANQHLEFLSKRLPQICWDCLASCCTRANLPQPSLSGLPEEWQLQLRNPSTNYVRETSHQSTDDGEYYSDESDDDIYDTGADTEDQSMHLLLEGDINRVKAKHGQDSLEIRNYGGLSDIDVDLIIDMNFLEPQIARAWGVDSKMPLTIRLSFNSEHYLDCGEMRVEVFQLEKSNNKGICKQTEKIVSNFISSQLKSGSSSLSNAKVEEAIENHELMEKKLEEKRKEMSKNKQSKGLLGNFISKFTKEKQIDFDESTAQLVEMGWDVEFSSYALNEAQGNLNKALDFLSGIKESHSDDEDTEESSKTYTRQKSKGAEVSNHDWLLELSDENGSLAAKKYKAIPSLSQGFLCQVVQYVLNRIPTLNEFCVICDETHLFSNGAMLKPTVCARELCSFAFQTLGVMADVADSIATGPEVVELLIAMCSAACHSNRRDIILEPYPTVVDPKNPKHMAISPNNKNFSVVEKAMDIVVNEFKALPTVLKEAMDTKNILAFPLLQWVLASNRCHIVKLPKDRQILSMKTPHQFLLLSAPPAKEAVFRKLKLKHGSTYAFHGSSLENWHSIMRNGLLNASGTKFQQNGAAYGAGIYLSPHASVSFGYSRMNYGISVTATPQRQGRPTMLSAGNLTCIALCEVVDGGKIKKSGNIWVLPVPEHVVTRFFFVFEQGCIGDQNFDTRQPNYLKEIENAVKSLIS